MATLASGEHLAIMAAVLPLATEVQVEVGCRAIMNRHIVRRCSLLLLLGAAAAAVAACSSKSHTETPTPPPPPVVSPVSEEQFGQALMRVIDDGSRAPQRHATLASVVRRQFARASERFRAGRPERGLAAVRGALYLVRAGELSLDMLDQNAAKALHDAHLVVAPLGLEGAALAFLHLQSQALPAAHPDQERIRQNLDALQGWMRDTRMRSAVENASADARAYGEQSMLDPSPESVQRAQAMTERWISAGNMSTSDAWGSRTGGTQNERFETYRATHAGAVTMVGLHLRHGDAQSAASALENTAARRTTPPSLYARLGAAANGDPEAWRDLASVFLDSTSGDDDGILMAPEVARGAGWGSALEAYRANPKLLSTAGPMALLLAEYGLAEGAPLALLPMVRAEPNANNISTALRIVADVLLGEDTAGDYPSVQRVFAGAQEILSTADTVQAKIPLDPPPSRLRGMMGSLHLRHGNLVQARAMFEQFVKEDPTLPGYHALAELRLQAEDPAGALDAVQKGLRAPDSGRDPIQRAGLHLLAFRAHRDRGTQMQARESLAAALRETLAGRDKAQNDYARTLADRLLARLAYHFNDVAAWRRAVNRMHERSFSDERVASLVLIETTSMGLLFRDLDTVRRVFDEMIDRADQDDAVYAALWVMLMEQAAGEKGSGTAKRALAGVGSGNLWTVHLARFGLGEIDAAGLRAKATNTIEREEADFYIAMWKRVRGEANADDELRKVAKGAGVDLVETFLARELLLPGSWGPAPSPLP